MLDELGLHAELPIDECKARSLTLGEKVSGRPIPSGWLDSPQLVYIITDPLPDLTVPPFGPQPAFLNEPQFTHPDRATTCGGTRYRQDGRLLRRLVAALRDGPTEEIMTLLDLGERYPGQRETLRADRLSWRTAGNAGRRAGPARLGRGPLLGLGENRRPGLELFRVSYTLSGLDYLLH
ncbi:hypothetical protein ACIBIZ_45480 [Nonomuraea spiralis]|uniref:hypothetical protein n=1 Tax=Nonomuraea spiralis TaxID=46182 RepID=UPI0037A4AD08